MKKNKSNFKFVKNWATACFFGWLIFSPVPGENSNQPHQPIETIYIRGGTKQHENPAPAQLPTDQNRSIKTFNEEPHTSSESKSLESKSLDAESGRVVVTPGNGNSPGGSGDDDPDITIGTKNWEELVCPNPDEIISNPEFWNRLQRDSETCLNEDEDACWDTETESESESESESTSEKTQLRRRLFAVNPNPAPVTQSMPTGKLDQQNLEKYDFTTQKIQPFHYRSREGILLSVDHRGLRKIIYSHAPELGLSDLISRIPCPIQLDPNKFQRIDCWAITDRNMRDALIKVFEYTTFIDPNIVTAEMPMHECPTHKATYFIDKTTGSSMYFYKGGKQDGKLWSVARFNPDEIPSMLQQPQVKVITDIEKKQL